MFCRGRAVGLFERGGVALGAHTLGGVDGLEAVSGRVGRAFVQGRSEEQINAVGARGFDGGGAHAVEPRDGLVEYSVAGSRDDSEFAGCGGSVLHGGFVALDG